MRELKNIKLPLELSGTPNEVTPFREKWTRYVAKSSWDCATVWEYVEMLHMWELVLKWKSPKVKELTPIALEVVAEIEETLKSITGSE